MRKLSVWGIKTKKSATIRTAAVLDPLVTGIRSFANHQLQLHFEKC